MKFGQAIDSVLFKNYFNLEGKASRSEYWWFMLFFIIFNFVAGIIVGIIVGISQGADFNPDSFTLYYTLGLLICRCRKRKKRSHSGFCSCNHFSTNSTYGNSRCDYTSG